MKHPWMTVALNFNTEGQAMKRNVARWEVKGGKDFLQLQEENGHYTYTGPTSGGSLPALPNDEAAIAYMERPWGNGGAGPVTVLKSDRPSTKRV